MSSSDSLDTTTTNESDSVKPTTPHYTSKFSSLSGFGMKILGKYGFQAGEGLGKNKDGIKDHVTTSKKYHQTGIGIGSEKEKKPNYWWENSYNQMLDSIAKKKSSSDSDSSDSSDEEEKKKKEKKEKKKEKKDKKEKKKEKKEKKKREEEEQSEEKSEKKEKKEKKSKKRSKKDSSDSDSSSSDEEEKSSKKTKHCVVEGSSVLQADFFKECEGRTLKKYRQEGKESRAKKHEEALVAKLKEAKEKMEAFNQQRKFKHVVTEKRKIQQNKVKVYRDFGDQ